MLVVRLIEEHVFPVPTLRGKVLQHAILADAMLQTELRCGAWCASVHAPLLSNGRSDAHPGSHSSALSLAAAIDLSNVFHRTLRQNSLPTWFPHCPTCRLMISRGITAVAPGLEWARCCPWRAAYMRSALEWARAARQRPGGVADEGVAGHQARW